MNKNVRNIYLFNLGDIYSSLGVTFSLVSDPRHHTNNYFNYNDFLMEMLNEPDN